MRVRRGWLENLAVALASILFVALCGEGVLRLVRWSPERYRPLVRLSSRGDLRLRNSSVVLDCYAIQSPRAKAVDLRLADVQARYRELGITDFSAALPESPWCIEFRYNSLGARGPEYGPRRPGVERIVIVGDSFTEGQGASVDQVYPSVLAARLEALDPGRYEVLNFGKRATDFPELNTLFDRALQLSPDLVIYGLCLNDGERSKEYDRRWPRLNDWIMVRRPRIRLPWWEPRLWVMLHERLEQWRISRDSTAWYRGMYGAANREGWDRTRGDLRRMKSAAESRHVPTLVAVWPLLVGLEADYPFREVHESLGRVFDRQGIPHLDLLEALQGRPSASLWAHPADRHPNGTAHALAAESLVPAVRRMLSGRGPAPPESPQG